MEKRIAIEQSSQESDDTKRVDTSVPQAATASHDAELLASPEDKEQALLEMEKTERSLFDQAREAIADYATAAAKFGQRKIQPWVLAGLVAIQSFAVETAIAKEAQADSSVDAIAEVAPQESHLSATTQATLESLAEDAATLRINPNDRGTPPLIVRPENWTDPIDVESPIHSVVINRLLGGLEKIEPPGASGKNPTLRAELCRSLHTGEHVSFLAVRQYASDQAGCWSGSDKKGNYLRVFRHKLAGSGSVVERVLVEPISLDVAVGRAPIEKSLDIDLSSVGSGQIESAIRQSELVELRAVEGVPIVASEGETEVAQEFIAEYGRDIEAGIATVAKRFGKKSRDMVSQVRIDRSFDENAYFHRNGNVIELEPLWLDAMAKEQGSGAKQQDNGHELVQTIVTHETNHAVDDLLRASTRTVDKSSPLVDVLNKMGKRVDWFNESTYFGGSSKSGHASDNVLELFVSVMNSLDYDNWEQWLSDGVDSNRGVYVESLQAILETLQDIAQEDPKRLDPNAPVFKDIAARIAAVQAMPPDEVPPDLSKRKR